MTILLFSKSVLEDENKIKFLFKFDQEKCKVSEGVLKGTAVPYNEQTQDWRKMSFAPGCFQDLQQVTSYVNHESWDVKSMVGVSNFSDSKKELRFEMQLNMKDPMITEKIIPLIEMGALEGVSIGADIFRREDVYDDGGNRIETIITEAEIYELSVVTFQAFENAKIKAKKEFDMTKEEQDKKDAEEKKKIELAKQKQIKDDEDAKLQKEKEDKEKADAEAAKKKADEDTEELSAKEQLKKANDEIAQLKSEKIETAKKDAVKKLIQAGVVHKAQEERILKSFALADSIIEFYKDIPASFSTEPKGESGIDVTSDDINSELHAELAEETSLSKEDYKKYAN